MTDHICLSSRPEIDIVKYHVGCFGFDIFHNVDSGAAGDTQDLPSLGGTHEVACLLLEHAQT
jgi:hypothetical protein